MSDDKKEIDQVTGTETTGHEWDGLKELNTPLPRWWLYCFYASIVWAIGYFVVMPAWPVITGDGWGATGGVVDYDQRRVVEEQVAANEARLEPYVQAINAKSFEQIQSDPELLQVAVTGGRIAFKENCAGCHGTGAQGFLGFPNLNDDDWIWGGSVDAIHTTLKHGIRWEADDDTRFSQMPAFGADEILTREDVRDVTEYVLSIAGRDHDAERAQNGAVVFEDQCSLCHGAQGRGDRTQGAPNLTDAIWLFGSERQQIFQTVYYARNAVMPAWSERLDPATVKQLALYVHSLGGGEPSDVQDAR
ncbi:MAG: cytochrome-c oxidase, cbb3-type subunit III [Pseudomonadota bacterium]